MSVRSIGGFVLNIRMRVPFTGRSDPRRIERAKLAPSDHAYLCSSVFICGSTFSPLYGGALARHWPTARQLFIDDRGISPKTGAKEMFETGIYLSRRCAPKRSRAARISAGILQAIHSPPFRLILRLAWQFQDARLAVASASDG